MSTYDSTAFRDQEREDGRRNIYFNGPGDGAAHGHVVQHEENGQTVYDYVRDVEGNVYINR
ncbi:hypothetical protein [Parafrankia sp. BMG5.11]|uniref:hypothetical protein n=1 Tax=Parafrankia sp. BMG5.11 TaxID=222540 RepID=UPI00103EF2DB|nr:hypothetical protein [Parafrankia sp. BMG5.11]TCJ40099.1 hypothetical protein E0504_06575 [Parafrankia sp. BMG5.11]